MSITVRSYTRRINGKLVTIGGYDANRNAQYGVPGSGAVHVSHHENVNRNSQFGIEAGVGTYVTPHVAQGLPGLTAYLYKPGTVENRDLPVYKWRRTHLPIKGAYKVPKSESGNQPSNSHDNSKAGDFDAVKL